MKATRFTFQDLHGRVPRSSDGKVCWMSDRNETIKQAKSWGGTHLVEMDDAGSILAIIVLSKIVREYQHLIYSVEKAAGIEPGAITRPGRTRCVAYARFAAVWLIHRRFPNWSLKQLSEAVGRKDHGTAIHALRMAENLIQKNDSFLNLIRRATAFQEPSHP